MVHWSWGPGSGWYGDRGQRGPSGGQGRGVWGLDKTWDVHLHNHTEHPVWTPVRNWGVVTTISFSPPKILNIRIFRFKDKNLSLKNYIKFGHYHSGFNIKLLVRMHKIIMLSTNIDIDINFVSIFRKIRYDDQGKFILTQMKFGLIFSIIHLNFFGSNLVAKVKFLRFLSYHFTYLYF